MGADIILEGAVQTGVPLTDWISLVMIIAGTALRTQVGWDAARQKNPGLRFDSAYVITAMMTSLTAFLMFSATPPVILGSKSLLIYAVTCLIFGYSGNEALNKIKKRM